MQLSSATVKVTNKHSTLIYQLQAQQVQCNYVQDYVTSEHATNCAMPRHIIHFELLEYIQIE